MGILKKYKYFLNEAAENNVELRNLQDVPHGVLTGVRKIIQGIYDKTSKPRFEVIPNKGLVFTFIATPTDFQFINYDEVLTLEGSQKKSAHYDIRLKINDVISETFEVSYLVEFKLNKITNASLIDEEDIEDEIIDEIESEEEDFDEDVLDNEIKKNKMKTKDYYEFDYDQIDDDDDF